MSDVGLPPGHRHRHAVQQGRAGDRRRTPGRRSRLRARREQAVPRLGGARRRRRVVGRRREDRPGSPGSGLRRSRRCGGGRGECARAGHAAGRRPRPAAAPGRPLRHRHAGACRGRATQSRARMGYAGRVTRPPPAGPVGGPQDRLVPRSRAGALAADLQDPGRDGLRRPPADRGVRGRPGRRRGAGAPVRSGGRHLGPDDVRPVRGAAPAAAGDPRGRRGRGQRDAGGRPPDRAGDRDAGDLRLGRRAGPVPELRCHRSGRGLPGLRLDDVHQRAVVRTSVPPIAVRGTQPRARPAPADRSSTSRRAA